MQAAATIFDSIVFRRAALEMKGAVGRSPEALAPKRSSGGKPLASATTYNPWFVRGFSSDRLGTAWPAFCQCLRSHGVKLFCTTSALESVPVAALPYRIGQRWLGEPINAGELKTADAFELACCDRNGQWGWPAEIGSRDKLSVLVQAIRAAVDWSTPTGISLPADCSSDDLGAAYHAEVDFITLVATGLERWDLWLVTQLERLRALNNERPDQSTAASQPPAIYVVGPIATAETATKLLALGASAVGIDQILEQTLEEGVATRPHSVGGMLSGMGIGDNRSNAADELSKTLQHLSHSTHRQLSICGLNQISELNRSHLAACSLDVQQTTGLELAY